MSKTVSFTAMKDGTREEYALLAQLEKPFLALTADRVLDELRRADEVTLEGYKISRLTHGLQSATRAMRDGADVRRRMIWNSRPNFGAEVWGSSGSGYAA